MAELPPNIPLVPSKTNPRIMGYLSLSLGPLFCSSRSESVFNQCPLWLQLLSHVVITILSFMSGQLWIVGDGVSPDIPLI